MVKIVLEFNSFDQIQLMAAKQGGKFFLMETQLMLPNANPRLYQESKWGVCVFQNLTVS